MINQSEASSCSQKRGRKSVSFYTRVVVKRVPSLKDCDDGTQNRIWFSNDEYEAMKRENKLIAERMKNNEPLQAGQCSRGLEYRTPVGMRKRHENKKRVLFAVLDEQDRQWDSNLYDPEALRTVSRIVSSPSQEESLSVGLSDERFVLSMQARRRAANTFEGRVAAPGLLLREIQQNPLCNKNDQGGEGPPLLIVVKSSHESKISKGRRQECVERQVRDGRPPLAPAVQQETVVNSAQASYHLYSVAA